MTPSTQAMQRDDTQNPGDAVGRDGEALWHRKAGAADKSCADCHGDAPASMRGVAARYPAFDAPLAAAGRPGAAHQPVPGAATARDAAARAKADELLGLEASSRSSRAGLPIAPPPDPRLARVARRAARSCYRQRIGQLDLACAQCHDDNAGRRLGGSVIPQGASDRRTRSTGWSGRAGLAAAAPARVPDRVRAEPFAYGATELVELELYLAARAAGMPIETPAVRP